MNYGMQGQQHPEHMTNSRQNKQTYKPSIPIGILIQCTESMYSYSTLRVCIESRTY